MSKTPDSWPINVGRETDIWWNVLLGGQPGVTISERCADAQVAERAAGKRGWGCVCCRALSWMIETDHCGKTLDPNFQEKTGAILWIGFWFGLVTLAVVGINILIARAI